MANRKRPSIKGKGMDFYLANEQEQSTQAPAPQADPPTKATFYLPPQLADQLDEVWLELRRYNRKLQKSHVVAAALRASFQEYETHKEDSTLVHQLTSKAS